MTTDVDQTIQTLFAKLNERKAKITQLKQDIARSWKTNGAFRLIGATSITNIQTASVETIEEIAVHISMIESSRTTAGERLGRQITANISGFTAAQWFDDLTKRLATIHVREEENQLGLLEARLNQVLSPEERRRIEVELLAKDLL
jgi:hypothetical protein